MKKILILLLIVSTLSTLGQTQKEIKKILKTKIHQPNKDSKTNIKEYKRNIKLIANYYKIDSFDLNSFNIVTTLLMLKQKVKLKDLTYQKLLNQLNEFKKTNEYKILRRNFELTDSLMRQKVNAKNWEKDIELIRKVHLLDDVDEFESYVNKNFKLTKFELTYGDLTKSFGGYLKEKRKQERKNFKRFKTYDSSISYSDVLCMPHGLKSYFVLEEGIAESRKNGKPILLYFCGHACLNARKMEENVMVVDKILKLLKEKFVLVCLNVDDYSELKPKHYYKTKKGKIIKTLGKANIYYQIDKFYCNAQPYFVIMTPKQKTIGKPMGFNLDPEVFYKFLKNGLKNYYK